ncbi:unnamed protein product [Adineta ricciae]|uniref:Uncharacterized protein n=1 Tax=Adineta ricciae TaxID=249248 RepID=A0A815MU59_ADIRI|nr:unnamed protein product [Adineta ricciae]CAF1460117.1 unnamed protein product [Adineta ricciae]
MIGIPMNANSVYVSVVQTGCASGEFDLTYPIHLNGIISQTEYQQSIQRINEALNSTKRMFNLFWIIFAVTMILSTISFLVSGLTAGKNISQSFYIFLALGVIFTTIGSVFVGVGACVINSKRQGRLRQAVAEESLRYSTRSPVPCSWRLDTSRNWMGAYGNQNNYNLAYNLVIDIGRSIPIENSHSTTYSNKISPAPVSTYDEVMNSSSPPSYVFQSVSSSCSKCNFPRQDLSMNFCSSCGNRFNR